MSVENSVMVFIEQTDNRIADVSKELISEARRLADQLGVAVSAVAMGHQLTSELLTLGQYGCDVVYYTDDPRLARFTSVPYAKTIVSVIKKYAPQVVLYGATTTGRDVAPHVASTLRCGLTADCTSLAIGDFTQQKKTYENALLQIRPAFGGNIVATIVSPESRPSMATVREGVMRMADPDPTGTVQIVDVPLAISDDDFLTEIIEVIRQERSVDLKGARIIVSAGMGAASPEGLELVQKLAAALGGVVGASRPVVDGGILSRDHQVGQTGTTVRPNLYIACGISGQIQHRAGMGESKRIIAINTDPEAPIFEIAHYGIVGDVTDVLPKMIKAYKAK